MTYVSSLKDIPTGPHWAIITVGSIWIEGDERSRTHPGHGYPGHNETVIAYQAFTDEKEWEKEVARMAAPSSGFSPKSFTAMKVYPATVRTNVIVSVNG